MNPRHGEFPADFDKAVAEVCPRTYYLDSRRLNRFGFSGVYLLADDGITLIETATSRVGPALLEAVRDLGFQERDIRTAIVTHIHLDHAGAAGWLARRLPHLRVYVHERGYRHLADPSRLLQSAKAVYGSLENVLKSHGEVLPVPEKNLAAVTDATLRIPGCRELRVFDAPGHARHHLCVLDPEAGSVFCGEALGMYLPERDILYPAAAPPAFDCEASKATIRGIRELGPRRIFFSQFGPHPDPGRALEEAERQLDYYYVFLKERFAQGMGIEETMRELAVDIFKMDVDLDWATRSTLRSFVLGYRGYFDRQ